MGKKQRAKAAGGTANSSHVPAAPAAAPPPAPTPPPAAPAAPAAAPAVEEDELDDDEGYTDEDDEYCEDDESYGDEDYYDEYAESLREPDDLDAVDVALTDEELAQFKLEVAELQLEMMAELVGGREAAPGAGLRLADLGLE